MSQNLRQICKRQFEKCGEPVRSWRCFCTMRTLLPAQRCNPCAKIRNNKNNRIRLMVDSFNACTVLAPSHDINWIFMMVRYLPVFLHHHGSAAMSGRQGLVAHLCNNNFYFWQVTRWDMKVQNNPDYFVRSSSHGPKRVQHYNKINSYHNEAQARMHRQVIFGKIVCGWQNIRQDTISVKNKCK